MKQWRREINKSKFFFSDKKNSNEKEDRNIYETFSQRYFDLYEEQTTTSDHFTLLNYDKNIFKVNQIKPPYSQNDFIIPKNFEDK